MRCLTCDFENGSATERCRSCGAPLSAADGAAALQTLPGGATLLGGLPSVGADEIVPGTVLAGRYRVLRQLGRGGMAIVWLASDQNLDGAPVVVKVPRRSLLEDETGDTAGTCRRRFLAEIKQLTTARRFEGVVTILDRGEHGDTPFYVLEYQTGGSLADRLAKGPQTTAQALEWLGPIATALDRIAALGLVHRDVKPSNILFADKPDPKADHPLEPRGARLSDFGIVKTLGNRLEALTGEHPAGTLEYMAPEQSDPGAVLSAACDQYALAATLYEALAGKRPFHDVPRLQLPGVRLRELPARVAGLPKDASDALMRALSISPAARFPTCEAFVQAFTRGLVEPLPIPVGSGRRGGRRGLGMLLALLLVVGGIALAAGLGSRGDPGPSEASRAARDARAPQDPPAPAAPDPAAAKTPAPPKPPEAVTPKQPDPAPLPPPDEKGPEFTDVKPASGTVVDAEVVLVEGTVVDPSGVASLTANGKQVPMGRRGPFQIRLPLPETGTLDVELRATDQAGNATVHRIEGLTRPPPTMEAVRSSLQAGQHAAAVQMAARLVTHDASRRQEVLDLLREAFAGWSPGADKSPEDRLAFGRAILGAFPQGVGEVRLDLLKAALGKSDSRGVGTMLQSWTEEDPETWTEEAQRAVVGVFLAGSGAPEAPVRPTGSSGGRMLQVLRARAPAAAADLQKALEEAQGRLDTLEGDALRNEVEFLVAADPQASAAIAASAVAVLQEKGPTGPREHRALERVRLVARSAPPDSGLAGAWADFTVRALLANDPAGVSAALDTRGLPEGDRRAIGASYVLRLLPVTPPPAALALTRATAAALLSMEDIPTGRVTTWLWRALDRARDEAAPEEVDRTLAIATKLGSAPKETEIRVLQALVSRLPASNPRVLELARRLGVLDRSALPKAALQALFLADFEAGDFVAALDGLKRLEAEGPLEASLADPATKVRAWARIYGMLALAKERESPLILHVLDRARGEDRVHQSRLRLTDLSSKEFAASVHASVNGSLLGTLRGNFDASGLRITNGQVDRRFDGVAGLVFPLGPPHEEMQRRWAVDPKSASYAWLYAKEGTTSALLQIPIRHIMDLGEAAGPNSKGGTHMNTFHDAYLLCDNRIPTNMTAWQRTQSVPLPRAPEGRKRVLRGSIGMVDQKKIWEPGRGTAKARTNLIAVEVQIDGRVAHTVNLVPPQWATEFSIPLSPDSTVAVFTAQVPGMLGQNLPRAIMNLRIELE